MNDNASAGQPISEAEALERLEQRDDPNQRYYAAWWLGRMRCQNPKAISLLIDALGSVLGQAASPDDLMVARNAARALGKLQSQAAQLKATSSCWPYGNCCSSRSTAPRPQRWASTLATC